VDSERFLANERFEDFRREVSVRRRDDRPPGSPGPRSVAWRAVALLGRSDARKEAAAGLANGTEMRVG
jgi:hypothetical protein